MTKATLKSLGMTRIGDQRYGGHGYQIVRVTNRFWRLSRIGEGQVATAGTCSALVGQLAALLEETADG